MKENFSITGFQKENEKSKGKKDSHENKYLKGNLYFNKTLSRNDINKNLIEKSLNRELLNDNYLEFIIHEKIKYADVDKIIEYYSERINYKLKKYNQNEILIRKKKQELKNLNMEIYSNVVKFVKLENIKDDYYDKEIDKTKKEINHKEHQIEIFQELYNNSYKLNFKLIKKLDKESIYSKIYEEQYQRYNEIYNNSINRMQRQEDKLNELKSFFKKCKIINNSLISDKLGKINKLEYEIETVKNNVSIYQESLEKIQAKIVKVQKNLDLIKNGYNIRKNEFYFIRKIYLKEYYKMFEIYQIFKVDDFEQILSEYKIIKKKYNELSSRFHGYSKEVMKLTMELKLNESKLVKTKNKINERIKKANLDLKKFNSNQIELINSQKKEHSSVNLQIYNEYKNKENLLNICMNYLLNIIQRIIQSINNSINKSPFSFINKFETKYNNYLNKNFTLANINYIEQINNPKLLLFIISLLKNAEIFIYQIIINIFNNLYLIINNEPEQQNNEEQIENDDNKINLIIKSDSKIIEEELNKQLQLSVKQIKLKNKIYSRNKEIILNNKLHEKSINSSLKNKKLNFSPSVEFITNLNSNQIYNKKKDFISPNDIFQDYKKYLYKNPIVDINNFSGINKNLFIERYTNDLVNEKKYNELLKNNKIKKIQEYTRIIKEKLEEKELNNFLKKKENKYVLQKINKKARRSEGEEDDEEEQRQEYEKTRLLLKKELEKSKKPKSFKIQFSNPETDRINNRYDDIKLLEYNFIKNYSNFSIDQNIFNEFFYNVKKKFNQMNTKINKNIELNNNNTGRSNNKVKVLLRNYSLILPKIEKNNKSFKNSFKIYSPGNSLNVKKYINFSP